MADDIETEILLADERSILQKYAWILKLGGFCVLLFVAAVFYSKRSNNSIEEGIRSHKYIAQFLAENPHFKIEATSYGFKLGNKKVVFKLYDQQTSHTIVHEKFKGIQKPELYILMGEEKKAVTTKNLNSLVLAQNGITKGP